MKKTDLEDLLTVEEAAPKIGMSRQTILNKISQKTFKIPYIKHRRIYFRPSDIQRYVDSKLIRVK